MLGGKLICTETVLEDCKGTSASIFYVDFTFEYALFAIADCLWLRVKSRGIMRRYKYRIFYLVMQIFWTEFFIYLKLK